MNIYETTSYFLTVVAITLAPGPLVLMLMVRSASSDVAGALGFGVGNAIGALIIITVVCLGLSAWLTAVPEIFEYSKYAMMAYILWLARGIWKGGFDLGTNCETQKRGLVPSIFAGILTCFISPYYMILFPLVLPEMMDITTIQMPDFLVIALTTFTSLLVGSSLIIGFASQLRQLVANPQYAMTLNRSLSGLLVVAGGYLAFI